MSQYIKMMLDELRKDRNIKHEVVTIDTECKRF